MHEILRYRDLVLTLVARELKVRYRRSVIGFLWTMLQPLLMMLVFYMVFSKLFRFNLPNYPVYALAGILFWNFFSQSIVASMNSLRGNALLLQKLPVPKAVFPLATVISGVVNLLFALVPTLLIVAAIHVRKELSAGGGGVEALAHALPPALLFLPVSILLAALFTLGAGLLLSPLAVFFSDVVELIGVLLTVLMYLTPIFYPMAILPDNVRWVVRFNPVRSILEVFRDPIHYGKVPPLEHLFVSAAIAAVALAVGAFAFRRSSDRIPFYV
jgi:ABC-type polysaccharide/polyol phosphate export permease